MDMSIVNQKDRLALAEAYRVYETLSGPEKDKIPDEFVDLMLTYGDLSLIGPLETNKSLKELELSKFGKYLILYMCTFK